MITIDGGTGKITHNSNEISLASGTITHNGVEIASDKMHDQWRLDADVSVTDAVLTGWVRPTESGSGAYLTGMSHSSGIFTFPKTGIYRIDFKGTFYKSDDRRWIGAVMKLSTNSGGSFGDLQRSYTMIKDIDANSSYATAITTHHVDVQDASTYRIRFEVSANGAVTVYGANDDTRTTVLFERIAST